MLATTTPGANPKRLYDAKRSSLITTAVLCVSRTNQNRFPLIPQLLDLTHYDRIAQRGNKKYCEIPIVEVTSGHSRNHHLDLKELFFFCA